MKNVENQSRSAIVSKIIQEVVGASYGAMAIQKRKSLPETTFDFVAHGAGHGIALNPVWSKESQKIMKVTDALYKRLAQKEIVNDYVAVVFDNKLYAMTTQESKDLNVNDETFYSSLWIGDFYDEDNGALINAVFGEHLDAEVQDKTLSELNIEMLKKYDEIIQKIKEI